MTKNLKVLSALALALAIGAGPVAAQSWVTPDKNELSRIRYHIVSGGTEVIIHYGPALLLGLIRSTGAEAAVLFLRDTTVVNGHVADNRQVMPRVHFFIGTGVTENPVPYPIPMRRGISADLDVTNLDEEVAIIYLPTF